MECNARNSAEENKVTKIKGCHIFFSSFFFVSYSVFLTVQNEQIAMLCTFCKENFFYFTFCFLLNLTGLFMKLCLKMVENIYKTKIAIPKSYFLCIIYCTRPGNHDIEEEGIFGYLLQYKLIPGATL